MQSMNRPKLLKLYEDDLKNKPYFTMEINVRWEEMDINGHINYANYLNYYGEARFHALGPEIFLALRKENIGAVVYKAELEFIKELFHPDTVHIVTWVDSSISKTRTSIGQRIYSVSSNQLISSALFYVIFMDTTRRKPVRTPLTIAEKFGLK